MQQKTKELLDDLRYLSPDAFCWNSKSKGNFSIFKLMESHGFIKTTNLESVFNNWKKIENQGAVSTEWATSLEERDDLPNKQEKEQRNQAHQSIIKLLESNLTDLQVLSISADYPLDYWDSQEFIDFDFSRLSLPLILGKTDDNNWLVISSTFPNELIYYKPFKTKSSISIKKKSNQLKMQIEEIIEQLRPIEIYGAYDGQYDYTYQHKIICNLASSKEQAIEEILQMSNMLNIIDFNESNVGSLFNDNWEIAAFFDENLKEINIYHLSFWCVATCYLVGKTITNDWLCISTDVQMHYNP